MRRKLSLTCLLLAWLCANGAVWNIVQVVGWAKMFRDYAQVMPATQALQLTFDGNAPCNLCEIAEAGQDAARDPQAPGTLGQRFGADASVELPVRIRTTETMVVPDYRIRAAVNWRF